MKLIDIFENVLKYLSIGICLVIAFLVGRWSKQGLKDYTFSLHLQNKKLVNIRKEINLLLTVQHAIHLSNIVLCAGFFGLICHFVADSHETKNFSDGNFWSQLFLEAIKLRYGILMIAVAFLSYYLTSKLILCRIEVLEAKKKNLVVSRVNFMRNLLKDLGDDLTESIRQILTKELNEENKEMRASLSIYQKSSLEKAFADQEIQNNLLEYRKFINKINEFKWCGKCMSSVADVVAIPLKKSTALLFDKYEKIAEESTRSETKNKGKTTLASNNEDRREETSLNLSESEIRENNPSNEYCRRNCMSRYLSMYHKAFLSMNQKLNSKDIKSKINSQRDIPMDTLKPNSLNTPKDKTHSLMSIMNDNQRRGKAIEQASRMFIFN